MSVFLVSILIMGSEPIHLRSRWHPIDAGFLQLLEIRENWKAFFQSGKSQGIYKDRITAGCVGLRYLYS